MLEYKELYITTDDSKLVIDVALLDLAYYEKSFIKRVIIDSDKTYSAAGPSSKPVYTYEATKVPASLDNLVKDFSGYLPKEDELEERITEPFLKRKRVRIELSDKDIEIQGRMFFIYVEVGGYVHPSTPCGMDKSSYMTVTYNKAHIYNSAIGVMKGVMQDVEKGELSTTLECNSLTSFILRVKTFDLAIDLNHFSEAIKLWNKIVGKSRCLSFIRKCHE